MTDPNAPRPTTPDPHDEGLWIDLHLGQLDDDEARALRARLSDDPALAEASAPWARLLDAERSLWAPELEAAASEAPRIAAQVRARAAHATSRTRPAPRQRRWARVLAISIGLHAAALVLLAIWVARDPAGSDDDPARLTASFADDAGLPDDTSAFADWFQEAVRDDPIAVPDDVLLGAADAPRVEEDDGDLHDWALEESRRRAARMPLQHPRDVAVSMWIRRTEDLKARRLTLLGFEADRTRRAVRRGLHWLGLRQRDDGSFEVPASGSALAQTSLALLPFLGDGYDSTLAVEGPAAAERGVVKRGVAWIRARLFDAGGDVVDGLGGAELGTATMALCEDYMLAYGRLRLSEASRRAREIGRLAQALRAQPETNAVGDQAPWVLWGLDAAARTGLVTPEAGEEARFQAWVASVGRDRETTDALAALTVGTAVLLGDRTADKADFRSWSEVHAASLLERLLPNGRVASDSDDVGAVAETARMLLALQIAYRTY